MLLLSKDTKYVNLKLKYYFTFSNCFSEIKLTNLLTDTQFNFHVDSKMAECSVTTM